MCGALNAKLLCHASHETQEAAYLDDCIALRVAKINVAAPVLGLARREKLKAMLTALLHPTSSLSH